MGHMAPGESVPGRRNCRCKCPEVAMPGAGLLSVSIQSRVPGSVPAVTPWPGSQSGLRAKGTQLDLGWGVRSQPPSWWVRHFVDPAPGRGRSQPLPEEGFVLAARILRLGGAAEVGGIG